jgi:phosphatidate cytidylyltransferase
MKNLLLTSLVLLLSTLDSSLASQPPQSLATIPKDPSADILSGGGANAPEALLAEAAAEEAPDTEAAVTPAPPVPKNPKLVNLMERTGSAVLVLAALTVFIRQTGGKGMQGLVLAAQICMFGECTRVASVSSGISKYVALATHMLAWNGPHLLTTAAAIVPLVAFGMFMASIILLVVQQNGAADFGPLLRDFGISHLSAATVVGLSSAWLATVSAYSLKWIFFPALLVIINDTMAYICGIIVGKHKLLPTVSPKKTWEGFSGAALFTVALSKPLFGWIMGSSMKATIDTKQLYLMAMYVSLVAPFGGFLASTVKRTFGAKDFGAIMPGHGGFVDRLDCQLVTAPFIFLYLLYKGGPEGLMV